MPSADDLVELRGGRELLIKTGGQITMEDGAILRRPVIQKQIGVGAKVGATAGWVVNAASDLPYIATLAASQTGSTLVVPIDGLNVGDYINGFKVMAQIESAGGTVILESMVRAVTNVAAEPTDEAFGATGHIEVTEDTAASGEYFLYGPTVTIGKRYYLVLTGTTAASTDIILLSITITVLEV